MDQPQAPLATTIDDAVTAFGRAARREVRRTMLALVASAITAVLFVVLAMGFAIAGVMRLSDALGRACGQWFGDPLLGDMAIGLVMLAVPVVGILLLRLRLGR